MDRLLSLRMRGFGAGTIITGHVSADAVSSSESRAGGGNDHSRSRAASPARGHVLSCLPSIFASSCGSASFLKRLLGESETELGSKTSTNT